MGILVNITRVPVVQSDQSFAIPIIISNTVRAYKQYTSLTELVADFASNTTVYKMATVLLNQDVKIKKFAVAGIAYTPGTTPTTTLTAFLDTLIADGQEFYAIMTEASDAVTQLAVSTWCTDKNKLYFCRTTTDPASYAQVLKNRTAMYYTATATDYPEADVLGKVLPKTVGSYGFNYQVLKNSVAVTLSSALKTSLATKKFNTVAKQNGSIATYGGLLQENGYFIDQILTQDYIKLSMEQAIVNLLLVVDKVPYTDDGIAQIASVVTAVLNKATTDGIIAKSEGDQPLFTVTTVPRKSIPQQDITDRTLRTLTFAYVEAGAIEGVEITGQVVVEL